jgi:hypothetical protein
MPCRKISGKTSLEIRLFADVLASLCGQGVPSREGAENCIFETRGITWECLEVARTSIKSVKRHNQDARCVRVAHL